MCCIIQFRIEYMLDNTIMYGKCVVIENVLDIHFFIEKSYWIFLHATCYCINRNSNKHFHHRIVFHFSACSFCIISPLISKKFNNHYLPMPEVIDFELTNYEKVLLSNFFNFFGSFVDIITTQYLVGWFFCYFCFHLF